MQLRSQPSLARALLLASAVSAALCLAACSSSKAPRQNSDRISFAVSGVYGELRENVELTLGAMPPIAKNRAFVFRREILDKTGQALRACGYYHPKIKLGFPKKDGPSRTVDVSIDPGKRLFIREADIEILGEGASYSSFERIIEKSGLKSYAPIDHGKYEELKKALQQNAMQLGFFDSKLIYSRIMVYEEQNCADIELVLDTGRRYSFGALIADDATRELLKPAAKLYNLDEGTPFSSRKIRDFQAAMSQTGYYRSVDFQPRPDLKHGYRLPMELKLERRPRNVMRLGIGFSTDERLRVLAEWDKPLLNSAGHSLSTYARISSVKQNAEAIYKIPRKDPNLDYYYLRLAQLHTDFNDTKSDISHASFHYVANHTGKWRRDWSLRAEYEDYTQGVEKGTAVDFMPGILLQRRESSGGSDPARAYDISADLSGGSKLFSDYDFFRAIVRMRAITSPTSRTRLLLRFTQGWNAGSDAMKIPPSLRFFAGGDNSVRGFSYLSESPRQDGLLTGGRYLTVGSVEFQFPLGSSEQRGAVFLDAGKAYNHLGGGDMLYGPGIGYRYPSRFGTVRVDLAAGISNSDTSFKLHFAFGPEF